MIDFGLRADLAQEAKLLGWGDAGIVSGKGEMLDGKVGDASYKVCVTKKPEVARKGKCDVLALDFEDLVLDLVIAKANDFVEFDLHSVIFGENRLRILQNFQKALLMCRKQKNKILVSMRAEDKFQLRAPRDVKDFLRVMGMTQEEVSRVDKNGKELLRKL